MIIPFLIGLVWLALIGSPQSTQAHGYLIRVYPENRAVLERSPSRLQAWFSEGLEARFSSFSLTNSRGEKIELTQSGVNSSNPAQLSARIPRILTNDAYLITMRVAFASDGHVFTEQIVFWVGEPTGDVGASNEARRADGFEILWRAITLPALYVLFGTALSYRLVLIPAWGNRRYRAGGLPPRVMARLSQVTWISLLVAVLGTVLAIIQQAGALFGVDPLTVIRDGLFNVIMSGTQIGDTLRARLIIMAIGAALLYAAGYATERTPFLVAPLWTSLIFATALALGTISVSSHAAGADLWLLPSVVIHWLHLLATAAWVGGLIALAAVIPTALSPLQGELKKDALMAVLRRFSGIGVGAVVLLIATGIYNSSIQVRDLDELWSTEYGLTLAAKLALIVPPLLLGLYHHLHAADDQITTRLKNMVARSPFSTRLMGRTIRAEAATGVLILIAAAVLAATPPPVPLEAANRLPAPTQTLVVEGIQFDLRLDPGAIGANAYELTLTRSDQPIAGARVWVRFVFPALDRRTAPLLFDDVGSGGYVLAGADLDRIGEWQVLIDAQVPGQLQPVRAAFPWSVPEIAPALYIRTASLFNVLGAGLVIGTMGALLIPALVRRVRALPLQPGAVLIGLAVTGVTVVALIAGTVIVSLSLSQTDRLRYPPPAVINPVLADYSSLERGREHFEGECRSCHLQAQDEVFRHTLSTRRDERLYQVILQGAGNHPFASFDDPAVWDVVNYLRSTAFLGQPK